MPREYASPVLMLAGLITILGALFGETPPLMMLAGAAALLLGYYLDPERGRGGPPWGGAW